jgi:carbon-monoxide dehydrogenase medium subunit
VKPAPFAYTRPENLEDCLEVLRREGDDAVILAGGQSLVPLLNMRLSRPGVVVDVNGLSALEGVDDLGATLRVGALTRAARAEKDEVVAAKIPVLVEALRFVGHPQTRTRTTIGGNVAHADPASELPAVLAAFDGRVELASMRGARDLPWDRYLLGPYLTAREPDELVVGVRLSPPVGFRWRFTELARRHGDFAIVGACVGLRVEAGNVAEARIALCGVGSVPVRREAAEALLVGPLPVGRGLGEVESAVREGLEPYGDVHATAEYRRAMAALLVRRSVEALAAASSTEEGGMAP